MDGLDKIIAEISAEAAAAANETIRAARTEAERIVSRACAEASEICAQAGETAELEYKKIVSHAEAEGLTAEKRAILNEKQSIISEVLNNALNSIQEMKPDRYFEFMQRLLERYAQDKEGEIILSARAKTWITPEFEQALSKRDIKISDKSCDDDGGFILVYGDIEENCLLTALIESERDRLHDSISLFLFGQESEI